MQAVFRFCQNASYQDAMPMGRPTERPRTPFGERIAASREAAGLSQKELADKLGLSQRAICWWEREPVALKPDQLTKLADLLGVSADYLLGREETKLRNAGPTGKVRRMFNSVAELPRRQQEKILATVEDMLLAHQTRKAG